MSPEWLTAIGTLGTFIVIATSAAAALVQLRHMRSSNQIAALNEVRKRVESPEFQNFVRMARRLPELFADSEIRKQLIAPEFEFSQEYQWVLVLIYFYEHLGVLVKNGVIDRDVACDTWAEPLLAYWPALAPVIANRRAALNQPNLWANFEYFATVCRDWIERHPDGAYPSGAPRMPMPALWPETKP